jgi:hypothetical protein
LDLTIDFTCPECQFPTSFSLREIAPGQLRRCPDCQVRLVLTPQNLSTLGRNLEAYCNS